MPADGVIPDNGCVTPALAFRGGAGSDRPLFFYAQRECFITSVASVLLANATADARCAFDKHG